MKTGHSRAQENKEIRRNALREQLKSQKYIQNIHRYLYTKWPAERVQEIKAKIDAYFRLLNKTLPDVKSIEFEGEMVHRTVSSEPMSQDDWTKQYGGDLETTAGPSESLN